MNKLERLNLGLPASSGYSGKTLMPRDIAKACRDIQLTGMQPWRNFELTKAIATALGESSGSLGAWHDNYTNGVLTSRDCGLFQDNIPARMIGTDYEDSLRTDSFDPDVYEKVEVRNIKFAYDLYNSDWQRNGKSDIRRWQPWVAYDSGWATFPEWWVWHQQDGNPVGPWIPTGRYIHKAISGQMNNMIVNEKLWRPEDALHYMQNYISYFKITSGEPYINNQGIIAWHIPAKPTAPPEDGVGPRPKANDGS
jgi:hypothetical protein